MARGVLLALRGIVFAAAAACSGSSFNLGDAGAAPPGDGGGAGDDAAIGPVSGDQACGDLATAACKKLESCAPALVALAFADLATCQSRTKLGCSASLGAKGTGLTPALVASCAPAYAAASCDDIASGKTPSACMVSGPVPAGGACAIPSQCAGGATCAVPSGQSCGVCSPQAAAGGSCNANVDCTPGLACTSSGDASLGTCVAPGRTGDTCDATKPCVPTLVCSDAGTCGPPLGAGAPCTGQACDTLHGLYCNPLTHVCAEAQSAMAGEPCGAAISTGVVTTCAASGRCKLASSSTMGTCEAAAADGTSCDAQNGPPCMAPANCVGGKCQLPGSADCP